MQNQINMWEPKLGVGHKPSKVKIPPGQNPSTPILSPHIEFNMEPYEILYYQEK